MTHRKPLIGRCPGCATEGEVFYVKAKTVGFIKVCAKCRDAMEKRGLLLKPERVFPI